MAFRFRKQKKRNLFGSRNGLLYIEGVNPTQIKPYVQVALLHSPYCTLTYHVPDTFVENLEPGHRVLVPLGRRVITGVVLDSADETDIETVRDIHDILDLNPLLTPELLRLTQWISEYYLCHQGEVIRTALPPGIHQTTQLNVSLCQIHPQVTLSEKQQTILRMLEKTSPLSVQSLEKKMNAGRLRFELNKLEDMGCLSLEHVLEEAKVKIRSENWVGVTPVVDKVLVEALQHRAPKQGNVLHDLFRMGHDVPRDEVDTDFATLRALETKGLIFIRQEESFRDAYLNAPVEAPKPVTLTDEQRSVVQTVQTHLNHFQVLLLHGVTGSGKTQVYMEAIAQVLEQGKTALVLIPEISLTPQAVQRYRGLFGNQVAVLHSRMSNGERYDSWRKIREGSFRIGLGPRSAVFAPLENLGLIVVDEEHETSYKQTDPSPRYHARDVAIVRAQINNCPVILGSATPNLESYFNAMQGKYLLCELTKRVDAVPMPEVVLVDRKPEDKMAVRHILTPLLVRKMKEQLDAGQQIVLLQNRRGYASFLRCQECGDIAHCPHCDIPLTFHQRGHLLRCHYCGYQRYANEVCSKCEGSTLRYRGVGTQRVEEEVADYFPEAKLFRMDLDTTRRKGAHDQIIHDFEKGKGDILLGTQMVAKGHDFPGVHLVGIISADTELFFPDFRSGERTFQLLSQASGRAGRRNRIGEVVIQTMYPDHEILAFVQRHDYLSFYQWEMKQRHEFHYPPWGRLIQVRFRGPSEQDTERAAQLFQQLAPRSDVVQVLGPVASPLARIKNLYRYQIIFRSSKTRDVSGNYLRRLVQEAWSRFSEAKKYGRVRLSIDVDPVDLM